MYSSIFRKKYSKKSHKIPKQKIMRSRKRVGGSLEPESTISTTEDNPEDIKSNPEDIKSNTEDIKSNPEDIKSNPEDIKSNPEDIKSNTEDIKSNPEDIKSNPEDNTEDNAEDIRPEIAEKIEPNVELGYIERQATSKYKNSNPETQWARTVVIEGGLNKKNAQIHMLDAGSLYGIRSNIIAEQINTLRKYRDNELENLEENKELHSNATEAYKNKRSNILKSIKKNRYYFAPLLTSLLTSEENIIERALQKDKTLREEVDKLVDLKVQMKQAKNNLEKSKYIVGMVSDAITSQSNKYRNVKWKEDTTGGSKKRIISKRHIKRRTKRHTQNNKRRYTKKTR